MRGEVRPVTLFARAPMLVPAEGQGTGSQPMAGLMAEAKRLQGRPGVLAVSLFPVQPWLDIPDTGFSVMAVADGPRRAAEIEPMVRQLAWQAWERRRGFAADLLTVDEAIHRALAAEGGPFVLSESADSTGSGSPGDGAHMLERLLALEVRDRCLVTVVDAPAVARAIAAGVGADVTTTLGGTLDPRYNRPVPVTGRVRILSDGRYVSSDKKSLGVEFQMGRAAVIEAGQIAILATERPAFTFDPALYRAVGLEPRDAKIVVVKSPLQFRDGYGDSPGPAGSSTRPARARRESSGSSGTIARAPFSRSTTTSSPRSPQSSPGEARLAVTGPRRPPSPSSAGAAPSGASSTMDACSTDTAVRPAGSSRAPAAAPTSSTSTDDSWASCSAATT